MFDANKEKEDKILGLFAVEKNVKVCYYIFICAKVTLIDFEAQGIDYSSFD